MKQQPPKLRFFNKVVVLASCIAASGCSQLLMKSPLFSAWPLQHTKSDTTGQCAPEKAWEDIPAYEAPDLWARIRKGYQLPTTSNTRIDQQRDWYARHPDYLARVSERGEPYLFYIVEQIESRQLPMELALLPIVESAFDPFAYSHGRASGMWQFIPGTGKMLGLKQNWWYDGRRDITASTDAALTYLEQLNAFFDGDWLLALAAYNSGAGNVSKAIAKNKKKGKPADFWHLSLPRETEDYVPRLLALAELYKNPDKYQLSIRPVANEPAFVKVDVESQIDLAQAALLAGIDMDTLYKLNPAFNRWATDPKGPHHLLIPVDKHDIFVENLAAIPLNERVVWERYTIRNGDTLSSIAKKYKVSIDALKDVNKLRGNNLRAGKSLMVPVAAAGPGFYTASVDQRLQKTRSRVAQNNKNSRVNYTVASGDSLWKIAALYGVSTRRIAKWNNMAPSDPIRAGQVLAIWPDKNAHRPTTANNGVVRKVSYKVRNGDSIHRIADKFKLSVNDIMKWNDLNPKKYLQPGQSITLFVDVTH